jgi:hypothetical protein
MDYVTIASSGNAADFGDLSGSRGFRLAGCGSSTRGVFGGGENQSNQYSNVIDYITFASTGNASDFGDLIQANQQLGACSSPTRGLFAGGNIGPGSNTNVIQYVTIASTGNAIDFGDTTAAWHNHTSPLYSHTHAYMGVST